MAVETRNGVFLRSVARIITGFVLFHNETAAAPPSHSQQEANRFSQRPVFTRVHSRVTIFWIG
ncbi:hypothetical protein MSC49_27220 [Methylosinus sp. C49]|nr:hypothetical protein MSC49_27220 [Methylosinus sp. C49]